MLAGNFVARPQLVGCFKSNLELKLIAMGSPFCRHLNFSTGF
jgi:hypothetical protein